VIDEQTARSFYSNTYGESKTPPSASQPSPTPQQAEQKAEAFFSEGNPSKEEHGSTVIEVPEEVRALREADSARAMFSPQKTYADAIKSGPDWPAENQAAAAEWREVAADFELSTDQTRELAELVYGMQELPSEQTRGEWWADAQRELRRAYGEQGAQEALADAQRLIERDPRVACFLRETGLNAHPRVVMLVAEKARSARTRGKLKGR
jgi:hypothetical protein